MRDALNETVISLGIHFPLGMDWSMLLKILITLKVQRRLVITEKEKTTNNKASKGWFIRITPLLMINEEEAILKKRINNRFVFVNY